MGGPRPEVKLTPALAESLRHRRRGRIGKSWYVDETYIKAHGHWRYLYRAIDRSGALDLVHGLRELKAKRGKGHGVRLWPWGRMTGWRAVHTV